MKKLTIDSGVQEYRLGSAVLRLNPADPNVISRFLQATERIRAVQESLLSDEGGMEQLVEADQKIKQQLTFAFGPENDFDKLLGGVNVFAPGKNGQPVIVNLLTALQPVLEEGVRRWTDEQVAKR